MAFLRRGFLPTGGATTKSLGEVRILWHPRPVQRPRYHVEPWSAIRTSSFPLKKIQNSATSRQMAFYTNHEVIPLKDVKMSRCQCPPISPQILSFNLLQSLDQAEDQRSQNIGIWSSTSFISFYLTDVSGIWHHT